MDKTIRALVARMADDAESGFAKGSIRLVGVVPVTDKFNPGKPPLGTARLVIDDDGVRVFAEMTLREGVDPVGKYPALGGTRHRFTTNTEGGNEIVTEFSAFEVGLCDKPNEDPQIPTIAAPVEPGVTDGR